MTLARTTARLVVLALATVLLAAILAPAPALADRGEEVTEGDLRLAQMEEPEQFRSESMTHIKNIAYELRYGEPVPHGTDIEFYSVAVEQEEEEGTGGEGPGGPGGTPPIGSSDVSVTRVTAQTPAGISTAVAGTAFENADTVVIARDDVYADALAGAPLAADRDAPLLLSDSQSLSPETATAINDLGASEAILLGGTAALSEQVQSDLSDLGLDVSRIGGDNRFGTAGLVFDELPATGEVLIAEGENTDPNRGFPDALSAGALGATDGLPVLLVNAERLPSETTERLASDTDVIIFGGDVAVSPQVEQEIDAAAGDVSRIAGETRFETSALAAAEAVDRGASLSQTYIASGGIFSDGLVSAAAAGAQNGVLLLVDGQNLEGSDASVQYLRDNADQVTRLVIVGADQQISDESAEELRAIVSDGAASDNQSSGSGAAFQQGATFQQEDPEDPDASDNNDPESGGVDPNADANDDAATSGVREYAVAGSYLNGMHIIDITTPEDPEIASIYDCGVLQGDVQIFTQGDGTFATYTSENTSSLVLESQCVVDAVDRGDIVFEDSNGNGEISGGEKAPGYGTYVADITDPLNPVSAGFIPVEEGSHNGTVHPSGEYFYNSDSALITDVTPQIQIYDIRDLENIERVNTVNLPTRPGLGTSSHDIDFSDNGTRMYSAALSQIVIFDSSDPVNPTIISDFNDEANETEHGVKFFSLTNEAGEERDFIATVDELAGAIPANVCPGGAVHFYDITGDKVEDPLANKVGLFEIPEQRLAGPDLIVTGDLVEDEFGESGTCTAHVMRVYPDAPGGAKMTIAWYNAGVRVLDLSPLAEATAGGTGTVAMPVDQLGYFYFENSDTWSFKTNKFEEDGSFFGYGNDILRGFDVYRFDASKSADAATDDAAAGAETRGVTTDVALVAGFALLPLIGWVRRRRSADIGAAR